MVVNDHQVKVVILVKGINLVTLQKNTLRVNNKNFIIWIRTPWH